MRNGIKWSIDGVGICVCVKEKSAIQVLGQSTNEKDFKPLIDMISKVVQEVFRVYIFVRTDKRQNIILLYVIPHVHETRSFCGLALSVSKNNITSSV